jgi:hypothetical protein
MGNEMRNETFKIWLSKMALKAALQIARNLYMVGSNDPAQETSA